MTGSAAILLVAAALLAGCDREPFPRLGTPVPRAIGNPQHGAELIENYGCGGCHTIRGLPGADGVVGPPLDGIADRVYVAGMLRNTPDNLEHWIRFPQSVVPGNVMPDMGINDADARDIAAYLYTRKD